MHYYDPEHIEANLIVLVIYKHTTNKKKIVLEIASIHDCKYFPVNTLERLLMKPKLLLKKNVIKDLPNEEFIEVVLTGTDFLRFKVLSTNIVTDSANKFHQIH